MSNIRPQQATAQEPPLSSPPPLPPGTVSIDKIWNLGLTLVLLVLIVLVGFFMTRGFWRFAMHKLDHWLSKRSESGAKTTRKSKQQQEEEDDDEEEEEEVEEVVVVKKKKSNATGRRR